jgi:hypothetical protein
MTAGGSAFAFCPHEGGSEELSGVFGGPPRLASSCVQRLHLRQQFVDALVPGGELRQQLVDPRQQRRHQMGTIATRRIILSLRHGERESTRRSRLNTSDPSHNAAEG